MRSFPALVLLIFLIAALIIIVGFIIASITHKYSAEDELQAEAGEQTEELLELDQNIYTLQLYSTEKISKAEHQQSKLENAGFKTKIIKSVVDDKIVYDLHLEGLYGENEARTLGEEIRRKVPSIQSYQLNQVGNGDEQGTVLTEKEKDDRIKQFLQQDEDISQPSTRDTEGTKYEIQIMASGNYARIEEVKETLASLGYKTKILTLNQRSQIIYRLRLKGLYSEREAIQIGEKLVKDSPLVTSYWLDEIEEGSAVQRRTEVTQAQPTRTTTDAGAKDFEIQILANTNLSTVRDFKATLERNGYPAKITRADVKGTTYYRLRLDKAYSKSAAEQVGKNLVNEIGFVKDFWIVKITPGERRVSDSAPVSRNVETRQPQVQQQQSSANPDYQSKEVNYSATCNRNSINIRTGPGTHFTIDPIGKLMRGITIFVVEEKDGWARFTITPNDKSWSGWVKLDYIDKN